MTRELLIEAFVQSEEKFGIKVTNTETGESFWINGFGKCPQALEKGMEAVIPFHKVEKNGKVYYNYGEKRGNMQEDMNEIRAQIVVLYKSLEEIKRALVKP